MNEEEAIETMKHWIEYEKANKDKINKADELIEIQETVLNLLEKKDIDIIETKEANRQLSVESKKKNKIIDEMARYITYCFNEDEGICKKSASAINYQSYYCDNNCKKCIKQYFERKVENEN